MYYIYHYIDPRDNLPFYVGKGKNNRCFDHLIETEEKTSNRHKFYRIQYLLQNKMSPIIKKVIEHIPNEEDAYTLESEEILKYGRIGFEEGGILTNVCLNSKPPSPKGKIKTELHRSRLAESHKGKKRSDESIKKQQESRIKNGTNISGMTGQHHTEDSKEKIRKSKTGVPMSDQSSMKKSEALKGKPWSEARKLASLTQRKSGPKNKNESTTNR